ncbi:hypothetical protein ACHAPT_012795 [Fusarium lateritium]
MASPSSPEAAPVTLPVSELVGMGDDELGQFIKEHRDAKGDYNLPVDDGWEKLSKDERDHLAGRLKAQEQALAQDIAPNYSHPLDLDDLDARLRRIPSDHDPTEARAPPQPPEQPRHLSPITYHRMESKEHETVFYHQLVSDGGRPLYPIELIDEVLEKPDEYREILQPLQKLPGANVPFDIFQDQLQRWNNFRKWQKDNRGLEDENDTYAAYVKETTYWRERDSLDWAYAEFSANMQANPLFLESDWETQQRIRDRERRFWRESGCNGFADYFAAIKRRLANHDFIRPFELKEDPKQQDQLTTWIEYLGFEFWWLDKHAGDVERLAPEHDKAW